MRSGKCYGVTDNLPTDYQHIADCRSSVGRLLVDSCLVLQRKSVDRQTANSRPTDDRQSVVCRPTNDQQTVNSRPTDNRQLADRRPTGFFGELFFTFTQICVVVNIVISHYYSARAVALYMYFYPYYHSVLLRALLCIFPTTFLKIAVSSYDPCRKFGEHERR